MRSESHGPGFSQALEATIRRRYKAKVFHGEAGACFRAERAVRRYWVAKEHHQLGDECRGEIQQHGDGTLAERGDGACAQAKILSHQ